MTGPAIWPAASTLAAPALRLLLRRRVRQGKEVAARLGERRGIDASTRPPGRLLWIHAASVGEGLSVLPVLEALDRRCPELAILLTTGTVTSATLMRARLDAAGLERVTHRFAPLDVPRWAGRFLDHWRPDAAAFVESELWPNLLAGCRARQIPTMLVNARLSPRSFGRWRWAPRLARRVLDSFDLIQAQSAEDADRLAALGARRVTAAGNLKFAAPPLPADPGALEELHTQLAGRPCWVAASTHPGEDEIVAAAHRDLANARPGLVSIVVPRHPERGAAVAAAAAGLAVTRRGLGEPPPSEGVWVADTLGELGLWYRLAAAALVGRSLVPPGGGQNPLEPARLGCPVAAGPHMDNFSDAVRALNAAGALTRVRDAADLSGWVGTMLDNPARHAAAGAAGAGAAAAYAHLPETTATALLELLARRRG
ncbi:MAG: 3-deoxy-D-manno-octulosonic acid transferase [Acetobacteraceae bacterium]|nr:3-deoxy-D-manno-octulosonic acid transferase [Acetobacteraceae bacterium]